MQFLNPNPSCEGNCKFSLGPTMVTAMGWTPQYDKHGQLLNQNPNITSGTIRCSECKRDWRHSTQYGKTDFEEIKE